ncbi:hypothetical protein MLD38_017281 [Melastoma candidum]|uniref:Uncharacterized protein n=1 Tax=Melastoma candidum TaxID=119954 RepID=A0ACB9QTN5_9MYRT|nr:hypothetical protein MLD38_017281 [Melastoma candidum]
MQPQASSEDLWRGNVLDPQGRTIRRWNKVFLMACIVSLIVDPLFLFLPIVRKEQCIEFDIPLEVSLLAIRCVADLFYIFHIFVQSRTAYVAPSSRVFGRGELVVDSSQVRARYLHGGFWADLLAALPLPQLMIWVTRPLLPDSTRMNARNVLLCIIIVQYPLRFLLVFPLWSEIVKAVDVISQTAWAGAAYNLTVFMLASHVLGAGWYHLSIDAHLTCWRTICHSTSSSCNEGFFDCRKVLDPARDAWYRSSNVSNVCSAASIFYDFGIYGQVVEKLNESPFFNKYFYCLWWGIQNLSCLGQSLATTTNIGENCYSIFVTILGLIFSALLISNIKRYLQSLMGRLEAWWLMRTDIEHWMHHRKLPRQLREDVRKHDYFKWLATKGVDEESILNGLPVGLRRAIKRHLCLKLVQRVILFDEMDESTLDAICERLKPMQYTKGMCLIREGDVVNEMLFIIRGNLLSYTTNGGSTGFLNSCQLSPGDFCGEELLTCALNPRPRADVLPISTRTVRAISDVEAFALRSEELNFLASQFRELRSKQLQGKFRFYSQQWRTWAAFSIQVAWRRHKNRKLVDESNAREAANERRSGSRSMVVPLKQEE